MRKISIILVYNLTSLLCYGQDTYTVKSDTGELAQFKLLPQVEVVATICCMKTYVCGHYSKQTRKNSKNLPDSLTYKPLGSVTKIYPNPARVGDALNIHTTKGYHTLIVVDGGGRLYETKSFTTNGVYKYTHRLLSGSYFITIDGRKTSKVIIQ